MTRPPFRAALLAASFAAPLVLCAPGPAWAEEPDTRPLSPAQVALFETPHLRNVTSPETLHYRFAAPGGVADRVALHVYGINPDGTKRLGFDYLTGERRVAYPPVEHFAGNPLLMLFLEQDVKGMKDRLGLSAAYFRTRIRQAFVDGATVTESTVSLDGRDVPARRITLRPFGDDRRLDRLPSVQGKTYVFVLADEVPGMVAEIRTELPPDPARDLPALVERLTYAGVTP